MIAVTTIQAQGMTQGWGKLVVGRGESTGKSKRQRWGGYEKGKGERDGKRKRRRERVSVLGL